MMRSVGLRPVHIDDAPALQAIYNHAVHHTTATMDTEDRPLDEQLAWIAAHDGAPYPGIVAVLGDDDNEAGETVVGYASLSPFHPRAGYRATVENSLYVHPDWQGRGVGRTLLVALLAEARERGFQSIVALISADNAPSLHLHRALGFADAGLLRAVGFKHGQWIDVAYLQYTVGTATNAAEADKAEAEEEKR